MSRKSGLLRLRSERGDGRIVVRDGLVCGAVVTGEPEDLRGLLVDGCFVPADDFDAALQEAPDASRGSAEQLCERVGLAPERLDALRRELIERAVLEMFEWRLGEFSFEVGGEVDARHGELLLPVGLNAQYLAMEAARRGDEPDAAGPEASAPEPELHFSGEAEEPEDEAPGREPAEAVEPARTAPRKPQRPLQLIAIDTELSALEWLKSVLKGNYQRVHIFQRAESGLARIRQYLARGEQPVVLISPSIEADPLAGAGDPPSLARRLRGLAPRLPILLVRDEALPFDTAPPEIDAVLCRPSAAQLARPERWGGCKQAGDALLAGIRYALEHGGAPPPAPPGELSLAEQLERLKHASTRLRESSARGEVLTLLLDFAAGLFGRVAIFMLRDERAIGVAQRGLERCGGPSDEALRALHIEVPGCPWFRAAIETRAPVRAAAGGEGDLALARALGAATPREVWVAPLESAGRVAALVYADMLPAAEPIGETTTLEILLCEAGLALDRVVLERALGDSS